MPAESIVQPPELAAEVRRVMKRRYPTIVEYARALIRLVHHHDPDGRPIGYDYGWIHAAILRKFPRVTYDGPHRGQPTRMPFKELWAMTRRMNRNGEHLPFRRRRSKRGAARKAPPRNAATRARRKAEPHSTAPMSA